MINKSRRGGLRILHADDEAHLRDLMQMELPRLGHEVVSCADGTAALKALERGTYDAALLDIRMPGISGIDVLTQIRQISPDTQVILLTGHATVDTAVQALRESMAELDVEAVLSGHTAGVNAIAVSPDGATSRRALTVRLDCGTAGTVRPCTP